MAFFEWDDEYSVGIVEIDEQHKKLLIRISEFYEAVKIDREEAFAYLLDSIIDYVSEHFSTEERYMATYEFPEAESHKEEHADFKDRILAVKEKLENGEHVVTLDTTRMLRHWVRDHVLGTDKRYSKFFMQCGLK